MNCGKRGVPCPGSASAWISHEFKTSAGGDLVISRTRSPKSDSSTLLSLEVLKRLDETAYPSGFRLKDMCGWLGFIPSVIGHSAVLDAGVKCMLRAHDRVLRPRSVSEEELHDYENAVVLLQKNIDLKGTQVSPETIHAAVSLALVEVGYFH